MSDLAEKRCIPCEGGIPPLKGAELEQLSSQVGPEWSVINDHHIHRDFSFPDFASALAFTNQVGELAEAEGHHPNIELTWGHVGITIYTHKIDGLTESDFILAAKINQLA
jgi:4a-hydroxytetrahydrobiopterin dehydratase